jgi:hypothetical protein
MLYHLEQKSKLYPADLAKLIEFEETTF